MAKKPFVYVALGDSTVEGIGASRPEKAFAHLVFEVIKKRVKKSIFHNLGQAGARAQDVLENQVKKAIELKPDLIVISVGANDVRVRTRIKEFEKTLRTILGLLSRNTEATIVINNIPDFSFIRAIPVYIKPFLRFWVIRFNRKIESIGEEFRAIFVDLYTDARIFLGFSELVSKDGFHPSDLGYAVWASSVINRIRGKIL